MEHSRYQDDYPARLIEWAIAHPGEGLLGFCAEVRVGRRQFNQWRSDHQEFGEAAEIAETINGAAYEKWNAQAAQGTTEGKYAPNGVALKNGVKNFGGWEVSDKGESNANVTIVLEADSEKL